MQSAVVYDADLTGIPDGQGKEHLQKIICATMTASVLKMICATMTAMVLKLFQYPEADGREMAGDKKPTTTQAQLCVSVPPVPTNIAASPLLPHRGAQQH